MSVEQLPPETPEEIAAKLRTLLSTCNIQPVTEDHCVEIDYCVEQLLTLAQQDARIAELEKALRDLVDHGEPLRGDGELWSNWQPRVQGWKAARAALEAR